MLQLFRNNTPYTVIILLIFTLILKLQVLMFPQVPVAVSNYFLYNWILQFIDKALNGNAFGYTMLTVIMLFLQSLYLNLITIRHRLFGKPTYIPALVFLLLTSIYKPFNVFSDVLLVNWCLLGAMDIILSFSQTTQPRKHLFNAGFLLCTAALLQFSAVEYLLVLMLAVVLLRPFNIGEWIVALMGYFTPIYFFTAILFLFDQLSLIKVWPYIGTSIPRHVHSPLYLAGTITGLLIMLACGIYAMQLHLPRNNIYVRRNWITIIFYLMVSIAVAVCSNILLLSAWMVIIPALTLIIAHAFSHEKNKAFSNFIFYFSLVLVVFCQMALK